MGLFSQRLGYKPLPVDIQLESMDDALRAGLWNVICENFFLPALIENNGYRDCPRGSLEALTRAIWRNFFRKPLDKTRRICPRPSLQSRSRDRSTAP
jgi:hypothetical protein